METLLAKLRLTGISAANEVVGYKPSDPQEGKASPQYDACVVEHHGESRARRADDREHPLPDLLEGECA